jgi:hypothetical protein
MNSSNRSSKQSRGKANAKKQPKGDKPKMAPMKEPKKQKQRQVAAAYATGQTGQGAQVQASRDTCRVKHREFIANVTGSVAFTVQQTLAVNPGIAATFPWLAGIAENWESYRFRKLNLCFYTRTGSNVPGSVIMAHDPDSSDAAPASEQVMTTYEGCQEDAPWKDICLKLRVTSLNDLGPRKFVRTAALPANTDIKLYDSGNMFVATVDGTAVAWGKLWVEYEIDFFTPQLAPAGSSVALAARTSGTTGLGTSVLFGTNAVVDSDSTLSITVNAAGSTVTFNQAFEGIASCNLVGSTCNTIAAGAGTATATVQGTNSAGTNGLAVVYITATAGQTFVPTCSGFSGPVSAAWYFTSMASSIKI